MANQIITNYCNADCDYCFAADSRFRMLHEGKQQMDEAEVKAWLDFAIRGGIRELRLLGGEPTLHPKFPDLVRIGIEAGCTIMVFSNGVMPDRARNALASLEPEACKVVINMNAAIRKEDEAVRLKTLESLGPRVSPGYTLTSADFSFWDAVSLIMTYGLRKNIRIGLSNPTWRGTNRVLDPKRYPAVGQTLFEQSFLTAKYGISLDADCGFVRCMFGNNLDQLKKNGFRYKSSCTPVLDLCTGGKILPCFGLSNLFSLNREDFQDTKEVFAFLSKRLKTWRKFGIYPECTECVYFETKECSGGCISARLRRLHPMGGPG